MSDGIGGLALRAYGQFTGATPTWTRRRGFTATIVDNAAGDWSVNLDANCGIDTTDIIYTMSEFAAVAASGLVAYGMAQTSDTEKRITRLQEAAMGGASALADGNFVITIWKETAVA